MTETSPETHFRLDVSREEIWRRMGAFPQRCDLDCELIESSESRGIVLEKVRYQIEAGEWVASYVGRPRDVESPLPGVVALHQHGGNRFCGKGEVFDTTGTELRRGIHGWGYELVKRGYVVLAPDQLCMEDRRWPSLESSSDASQETFETLSRFATGASYMAKLAFDSMRAVDVLQARQDVDPLRIGAIGTSGGGQQAYTLALADARVTAVVVSSGISSTSAAIRGTGGASGMGLIPGWLEVGDLAAGIAAAAPRAILIGSGSEDYLFPTDGVYNTYLRGKQAYEQLGCPERLHLHLFPGTHLFLPDLRSLYYDWLDRHLQGRPIDSEEIWYRHRNPIDVRHYQAARIAGPYREAPVDPKPVVLSRIEGRRCDLEQVRIMVDDTPVNPNRREELEPYDRPSEFMQHIRSLVLETSWLDLSIMVPHGPSNDGARRPATIVLHRSATGPAAITREEPLGLAGDERFALAPALIEAGHVVAAIDLIGHGERQARKLCRRWPGNTEVQLTSPMMHFLAAGTTLMARSLYDIARVVDHLAGRDDVDADRISLVGYGMGGLMGLLAAVQEPRLGAIACVGGLTTIQSAIDHRVVDNFCLYRPDIHLAGDIDEEVRAVRPRPMRIHVYEQDDAAPPDGAEAVLEALGDRFGEHGCGDKLEVLRSRGSLDADPPATRDLAKWLMKVSSSAQVGAG